MNLNDILRRFPVTEAVKALQIGNQGTDKEYYIDNRTTADLDFNYNVYPLTANKTHWVYVCPNCLQLHIRPKRTTYKYDPDYTYMETFQVPEDEVSAENILCFKNEDTGKAPCMIHIFDNEGMTVYSQDEEEFVYDILRCSIGEPEKLAAWRKLFY